MSRGVGYIKLLGLINVIYVIFRVLLVYKPLKVGDILDVLVTVLINLVFGLGILYFIYKKHNGVRLFAIVLNLAGLIASINMLFNNSLIMIQIASIAYSIACLIILSKKEVIDYVRMDEMAA